MLSRENMPPYSQVLKDFPPRVLGPPKQPGEQDFEQGQEATVVVTELKAQ